MKPFLFIFVLILTTVDAHEDPKGDIRPTFHTTASGELFVRFFRHEVASSRKDSSEMVTRYAMVADGALQNATETAPDKIHPNGLSTSPPGKWIFTAGDVFIFGSAFKEKPCLFTLNDNHPKLISPNWGDHLEKWHRPYRYAVTSKHFVFLIDAPAGGITFDPFGASTPHWFFIDRQTLDVDYFSLLGAVTLTGPMADALLTEIEVFGDIVHVCWSMWQEGSPPSLVVTAVSPIGKRMDIMIEEQFKTNGSADLIVHESSVYVVYDLPDRNDLDSRIHLFRHQAGMNSAK